MTKIFVPQPIPEAATELLHELGDVTIFPDTDRQISQAELLESVRDKDILYALGEIPYDERIIDAAKELKDTRRKLIQLPETISDFAKFPDLVGCQTDRKYSYLWEYAYA